MIRVLRSSKLLGGEARQTGKLNRIKAFKGGGLQHLSNEFQHLF